VAPVHLSGTSEQNTAPFELPAGDYKVSWSASSTTESPCFLGAALKSPSDSSVFVGSISADVPATGTATGETRIYGLKSGTYFEFVTSHCKWTIEIAPA
jgi:hypothetical protein